MAITELQELQLRLSRLQLEHRASGKQKEFLLNNFPADITMSAWCADLTEDLAGSVGTAEIPGERDQVLIRPGFTDAAIFNSSRDGQLQPSLASFPAAFLYNLMLLPGWQKFKPTYRIGTIVADSIDFGADTCDICLEPAYSSQQNLDVNQSQGFSQCDYETPSQFTNLCSRYPAHPT